MTVIDFAPATTAMAKLVQGVPEESLGAPTPCPDYTLGDLVDHINNVAVAFALAARKERPPVGEAAAKRGQGSVERLPADWRTGLPVRLDALAEAWRDPAAYEGMTHAGQVDMPGEFCALVALDELVLHGWDIARTTGQPFEPDPAHVELVHGFVLQWTTPEMAEMRSGLFGPVVEVPADASLFVKTLGLAGRDPHWTT